MRWRARLSVALSRWLLMLLACCACAFALDPALDVSQYAHTAWSIQDGSLPGGVRAIAQTPDGYLWLGTEFGLARFDGVRFVSWTPPSGQRLPSTNIRSLLAARDGTLWIGTLEGLASWQSGRLTVYDELARQNILTLLQGSEGTVWAGTFQVQRAKLCAIQSGNVQCYGDDGSFGEWVYSLFEDHEHRMWVGAQTGLWRWNPGPPKRYSMPHAIETSQAIVEGDNRAGLLAIGEGIWQLADETIHEYQMATPLGRLMPVNLFRDRDGGLWVGTLQRGLLHVHEGRTSVFAQRDGLSNDRVLCFFEDREGSIWVGTSQGLDRFRQTRIFSISEKQGLSAPSVVSVLAARDNSVWLSSLDGLNRWKDGQVTIYWPDRHGAKETVRAEATGETQSSFYTTDKRKEVAEVAAPGLPDNTVGSLYEDQRGRIWVSAPKGISRFENGRFTEVKELPGGWVNAITGDARAGIWISYENRGLLHWVDGSVVERVPWSRLGGNVAAASVIADPVRGGLWLGFFQGGLMHFKDGQIRASYGQKEGLGGGRVRGLQLDADGTLWAATEGGVSRLKDGKILTLSSSNGLPCDTVHWVVEADASFWLYTACGLLRIPRTEVEKWAANPAERIQFTVFDRSDGVRSRALLTGYTPLVSKSADGRLWFTNLDSLSVIDPRHLTLNQTAPPVHIEQVMADDKTYGASNGLRLPPRVRNLAIEYTALSLVAPEKVRFRYKLEGQNRNWHDVVNHREVQYTNLAPGTYRFRVLACNNSGVWNEEGATLDFVIPPAWYQTNWFFSLCAAVFLTIFWMLHRVRLHQHARQFNRTLEARVGERTRIARDLHDTLLQSFHGLLVRFHSVSQLLPERPLDAKHRLDSTIEEAAEAITEARDAVQGLRSSTVTTNELALTLKTLGEELAINEANPTSPRFGVEVFGASRELHPIVRDEVYRVAAEALRNAFLHAHALQIEVEIRYENRGLILRIHDDGKGIDPQVVVGEGRTGHYGLRGMRERAKLVGGKLEVWSELNAGTEIELTVPAANAYTKVGRRRWWILPFSRKGKEDEMKIES